MVWITHKRVLDHVSAGNDVCFPGNERRFSRRRIIKKFLLHWNGCLRVGVQDRLIRLTLDKDGNLRMYSWSVGSSNWIVEWKFKLNECEIYGHCGLYSICTIGQCKCPDEFQFMTRTGQGWGVSGSPRRRIATKPSMNSTTQSLQLCKPTGHSVTWTISKA